MAPPSEPTYVGRSGGYDFATASDNEDDVTGVASTSASFAGGETTILGFADGFMRDRDLVDFRQSKVGGLPVSKHSSAPDQSHLIAPLLCNAWHCHSKIDRESSVPREC